MKRLLAVLLCLCLVFGASATLAQEAPALTMEWDLTQMIADQAAFDANYAAAEALLPQFDALRGKIATPEGLLALQNLSIEVKRLMYPLECYTTLRTALDRTDAEAKTLMARVEALRTRVNQATSFADAELGALTLEERVALLNAPELAEFAYHLRNIGDEHTVFYSEETNSALALLNDSLMDVDRIYQTLVYADLPEAVYTTPEGEKIELTDSVYYDYVMGDASREELKSIVDLRALRYRPYQNTFAALLDAHMKTHVAKAKLNRFDSALEYQLHGLGVDPKVYTMLVDAAHEGIKDNLRYTSAIKRSLGLEGQVMFGFDNTRANADVLRELSYEEGAQNTLDALALLGDEYIGVVRRMLETGHMEVYPADNKDTGAFSCNALAPVLPYILLNYISGNDARSIAHEMGHSVYSYMGGQNQPLQYAEPSPFTHEVASTTNEFLYLRYMYDHAEDDAERLFYLKDQIELFNVNFFTQMWFSEFEDDCYKLIESGETLTADKLNADFTRLDQLYNGDYYYDPDGTESYWGSIPHFYYDYYMFQYASSACFASAIADRLYRGEEGAKESYLEFLRLGGSVSPMEALAVAGVDPLSESTYQTAMSYYAELVDRYEALVDAK